MSVYQQCEICKEWDWTRGHVCPPIYEYCGDEGLLNDPDEWVQVRARDEEEAAIKAAFACDSAAGEMHDMTLWVRARGDTTIHRMELHGELEPVYRVDSRSVYLPKESPA